MVAIHQYAAKLTAPPLFYCSRPTTIAAHNSSAILGFNLHYQTLPRKIQWRQLKYSRGAIRTSSEGGNSSTADEAAARWLLEPIGDGDTKHIGFKAAMPNAIEIGSSVVTIGRVPEKANVVIPVPTVSAVHARIRNTDQSLVITDLDSTNGTFIDERRLTPGVPSIATPGNKITFGDTHLAIFRVLKLENVEPIADEAPESEDKSENKELSS